jgi:hypothetical protein
MADLSVPYVNEQATKGMEEGKTEVSRQHMSAPLLSITCLVSCSHMLLACYLQMLKTLHDPGREGTEVGSDSNWVPSGLGCSLV